MRGAGQRAPGTGEDMERCVRLVLAAAVLVKEVWRELGLVDAAGRPGSGGRVAAPGRALMLLALWRCVDPAPVAADGDAGGGLRAAVGLVRGAELDRTPAVPAAVGGRAGKAACHCSNGSCCGRVQASAPDTQGVLDCCAVLWVWCCGGAGAVPDKCMGPGSPSSMCCKKLASSSSRSRPSMACSACARR